MNSALDDTDHHDMTRSLVVTLLLFLPASACGVVATVYQYRKERHRAPGVSSWQAMSHPAAEIRSELFTPEGNRFRRLQLWWTRAALLLGLLGAALSLLLT